MTKRHRIRTRHIVFPDKMNLELPESIERTMQNTLDEIPHNLNSQFLFVYLTTLVDTNRKNTAGIRNLTRQIFNTLVQRLLSEKHLRKIVYILIYLADRLGCQSDPFRDSVAALSIEKPHFFETNIILLEYLLKKNIEATDIVERLTNSDYFKNIDVSNLRKLRHALLSSRPELYGGEAIINKITSHPNFNVSLDSPVHLLKGLFSETT